MIRKGSPEENKYIINEVMLHQRISHENIISFVQFFETDLHFYIILEYAANGDLFEFLYSQKTDQKQLLRIFYQVCQAIKYLHDRDIMHRDLKPENILLDANFNAKLCDFGYSNFFRESILRQSLCGSLKYLSYEVLIGENQTTKTDIWSLGIILFEIYHKRVPIEEKTLRQ